MKSYLWLINMVVKTHLAICLESVCGQACVYRHIARCVFTTIFINHAIPLPDIDLQLSGYQLVQLLSHHLMVKYLVVLMGHRVLRGSLVLFFTLPLIIGSPCEMEMSSSNESKITL